MKKGEALGLPFLFGASPLWGDAPYSQQHPTAGYLRSTCDTSRTAPVSALVVIAA